VVRVSGPLAHPIAQALSSETKLQHGQLVLRTLRGPGGAVLDRGYAVAFDAPRSFTGENTAEFQVHGSLAVVEAVQRACCELGARPARPGEFTLRAWRNGKLDLLQAEALADLISARSEAARRAAIDHLDGQLSRRIAQLRTPLVQALAALEAQLDFAEEVDPPDLAAQLDELARDVEALLTTARAGRVRLHGARVVLYGAPNAGKSTLFNALCGMDRALVDAQPGTTRDTIEAQTAPDGLLLTWVDTAGVRETADDLERRGAERAKAELLHADVVLWLEDGSPQPPTLAPPQRDAKVLRVRSKADLAGAPEPTEGLCVSARSGAGMAALRAAILCAVRDLQEPATATQVGIARERHAEALRQALAALARARAALAADMAPEFIAADLRDAVAALDELTGAVVADDVLAAVFARFCIGK